MSHFFKWFPGFPVGLAWSRYTINHTWRSWCGQARGAYAITGDCGFMMAFQVLARQEETSLVFWMLLVSMMPDKNNITKDDLNYFGSSAGKLWSDSNWILWPVLLMAVESCSTDVKDLVKTGINYHWESCNFGARKSTKRKSRCVLERSEPTFLFLLKWNQHFFFVVFWKLVSLGMYQLGMISLL